MCLSSGLVVLNKYLLSYVGFQYPMTLSGLGMVFSAIASFVTCKVRCNPTWLLMRPLRALLSHVCLVKRCCSTFEGHSVRETQHVGGCLVQVLHLVSTRTPMTAKNYATHVMPVGLSMALSLFFGNLSYLYLSMSFIQILKVSMSGARYWWWQRILAGLRC